MSWAKQWLEKHSAISVARIISDKEQERANPDRKYCSSCHRKFGKGRPKHYREVYLNGVHQGRYYQTWCRQCHFAMDRATSAIQQKMFGVFDKETKQCLSKFNLYYIGFKEAVDRSGFDIDAIYTNLPIDIELSFKDRYKEDIKNPYEYDTD